MRRIAILGARYTGKTQLAHALADRLQAQGLRARVIADPLPPWVDRAGRWPDTIELATIALAHSREFLATQAVDVVIADTTPLIWAAFSQGHLDDALAQAIAQAHRHHTDITLLAALDQPAPDDRSLREDAEAQVHQDDRLREALTRAGIGWQVLTGPLASRVDRAMRTINSIAVDDHSTLGTTQNHPEMGSESGYCALCGDAASERRLFTALLAAAPAAGPGAGPQ